VTRATHRWRSATGWLGKPARPAEPHRQRVWRPLGPRASRTPFLLAKLGWVLLVAAVVTLGAAALSWTRTPMYRSSADVLVEPRAVPGVTTLQAPDMGTEKAIASSGAVVALASHSLGVPTGDLSAGLSVSVPVDTHVLRISVSNPDPVQARLWAQTLAEAYVAFHASALPAGLPAGAKPPAQIITSAGLPRSPASPDHLLDLGVAAVIGLSLGVGTAILRDRFDDRVRGPADLEERTGAPTLALVPAFRRRRDGFAGRLVIGHGPDSAVAEAYRNLRSRVLQVARHGEVRTIVVTSPARQATTTVAANLAAALALTGRRVVLVCADLRRPRAHQLFGVDNRVGLTGVVAGASLVQALRTTGIDGLMMLPAGEYAVDPGAVLQAPVLPRVLDELRRRADLVVIEAPPVLAGADTPALAERAELVLLVGDARRTTRGEVDAAARQLTHVRATVAGCVLDNVGRTRRLPRLAARETPYRGSVAVPAAGDGATMPPTGDGAPVPPGGDGAVAELPRMLLGVGDTQVTQPTNHTPITGR
jgi:polysaccharide biosynthesis transport protein